MSEGIGTLFEIPYFNQLTAGEFDASASFDTNTPVSHVMYSLQTLGLYQTPGQTTRSDLLTWGNPPVAGVQEGPSPGECSTFDLYCYLTKFLASDIVKDYSKRVGLVLVAVLLIVIAIVSLR